MHNYPKTLQLGLRCCPSALKCYLRLGLLTQNCVVFAVVSLQKTDLLGNTCVCKYSLKRQRESTFCQHEIFMETMKYLLKQHFLKIFGAIVYVTVLVLFIEFQFKTDRPKRKLAQITDNGKFLK